MTDDNSPGLSEEHAQAAALNAGTGHLSFRLRVSPTPDGKAWQWHGVIDIGDAGEGSHLSDPNGIRLYPTARAAFEAAGVAAELACQRWQYPTSESE